MNSLLGLDIGSYSIKVVEVGQAHAGPVLLAAGNMRTPPKALTSNIETDTEALAQTIKKLAQDIGVKSRLVAIALPESQVFTRVIDVPQLTKQELATAMKWEAEQYIPLPLDQVNIDFNVLRDAKQTGTGNMEILLVAAPKILIDKYINLVERAGLSCVGIETEILSASRALLKQGAGKKSEMIVSLGAQTTDLAILNNGVLSFTRSISAGGEALSRALVQGLGFQQSQAEEYKKAYGLQKNQLEGKIAAAVRPVMDTIISEMKRAVTFYQERHKNDRVETIILSGGTARIPGMVNYISEQMAIETQLANPWFGISVDQRFSALAADAAVYSVAVGLALKGY